MKKTTLVAPLEDPLARAVADEAARAGRSVFSLSHTPDGDDAAPLGSGGFAAARGALLAALNRLDSLDVVVFVFDPSGAARGLDPAAISPRDLESAIDGAIKMPLHFVRETLAELDHSGGGRLLVVARIPDEEGADPLVLLADAAFRAWMRGLFATLSGRPYALLGLELRDAADEQALVAVRKLLEGDPAKLGARWHRVGARAGLFGGL